MQLLRQRLYGWNQALRRPECNSPFCWGTTCRLTIEAWGQPDAQAYWTADSIGTPLRLLYGEAAWPPGASTDCI